MRNLNASQKLAVLTVTIVVFCFAYFLWIESARAHRAETEIAQLTPASVSAIYLPNGHVITDRAEINAIVSAIQRSHWSAFGRRYASERRRLFLVRNHSPSYIVDLRGDLVQVVRFNSGNQTEMLVVSGENSEIGPMLRKSRVTGLSAP